MKTLSTVILLVMTMQSSFALTEKNLSISDSYRAEEIRAQLIEEFDELNSEVDDERIEKRYFRKLKREYRRVLRKAQKMLDDPDGRSVYSISHIRYMKKYYFYKLDHEKMRTKETQIENLKRIVSGEAYDDLVTEMKRTIVAHGGIRIFLARKKEVVRCFTKLNLLYIAATTAGVVTIAGTIILNPISGVLALAAFVGGAIGTGAISGQFIWASCNYVSWPFGRI